MIRAAVAFVLALAPAPAPQGTAPPPDIEVFVQPGCPHCARAKAFLAELAREQPALIILERDLEADPGAARRLVQAADSQGLQQLGVPAFLVRGTLLVGFDRAENSGRIIRDLLSARAGEVVESRPAGARDVIEAPIFGSLRVSELGLPLFTVLVGLVDGFNPCAMWALLFILSLLVNLQSRGRMLAVGGTFVLVAGVMYYAFLAAWLEFFLLIGFSRALQVVLGGVALTVGALNLKDAVALGRRPSLSIPETAKQSLYARMRRVLTASNLAGALVAVAILSVMVNLVELLCTAGLPAVYTEILSSRQMNRPAYYGYLGLYIVAYVLDDSLVLAAATITLSRRKLQERGGRWLKLLSGAVMLALGAALLFRPDWVS